MANSSTPNEFLQCDPNAATPVYPFLSAGWYSGSSLESNQNGVCSGHGECVQQDSGLFKCVCDAGWTGLSDLINTEGIDCQINDLAVRIEWGVILLLAVLVVVSTFDSVRDRVQKHWELKAARRAQGKRYTIWKNNRTLLAMALCNIGVFPSIIGLAILRIVDPNERAGVTYGYSILFFTGKLTFYFAALIYQPALLASLLKGGKKDKEKIAAIISLGYVSQYVTFTLSIIAACAPFPILFDTNKGVTELSQIVYLAYFAIQVASMIILCTVAIVIKVRASKLFSESYAVSQDERTKTLQTKIDSLEKKAAISSSVIGIVYFVYTIIPLLWNKHDYVFPITWIPFVILGREINLQHIKEKGSSSRGDSKVESGSMKRFGSKVTGLFKSSTNNPQYSPGGGSKDDGSKELTNSPSDFDDGYV